VLLVLTEWDDFKWISPTTIATTMNGKQIIDARNLLDRKDWERVGFTYQGIGR
jgi:UDPglucose 6-dehydrogenase